MSYKRKLYPLVIVTVRNLSLDGGNASSVVKYSPLGGDVDVRTLRSIHHICEVMSLNITIDDYGSQAEKLYVQISLKKKS